MVEDNLFALGTRNGRDRSTSHRNRQSELRMPPPHSKCFGDRFVELERPLVLVIANLELGTSILSYAAVRCPLACQKRCVQVELAIRFDQESFRVVSFIISIRHARGCSSCTSYSGLFVRVIHPEIMYSDCNATTSRRPSAVIIQ
jgi:hypothetical protein